MGILIFGSGGGGNSGGGVDLSSDTIEAKYVLNPYTFHDKDGNPFTGLIYNWDGTILSGASSDGNKSTIQPSSSTRHIAAGSYLNREIELAPMPAGSASMAQDGNKVTLTKSAGYIPSGSESLTLEAGSTSLRRSGATVHLDTTAGYIAGGESVAQLTIPLANSSVNVTANGTQVVNAPSGTAGMASVTIYTSVAGTVPQLQTRSVTITKNETTTYSATSSAYAGLAALTVTTSVYPSTDAGTVSNGSSTLTISCATGKMLYMVGFMASSASYSNTNKVVGGYARKGASSGRGSYITATGDPAVGGLTASFSGNTATITPLSGYSFSGMSYTAFVCYI